MIELQTTTDSVVQMAELLRNIAGDLAGGDYDTMTMTEKSICRQLVVAGLLRLECKDYCKEVIQVQ